MNKPYRVKKKLSKFSFLTFWLLALGFVSCGLPPAPQKKLSSEHITYPDFEAFSEGFNLSEEDKENNFAGAIILLEDQVTIDELSDNLKVSKKLKKLESFFKPLKVKKERVEDEKNQVLNKSEEVIKSLSQIIFSQALDKRTELLDYFEKKWQQIKAPEKEKKLAAFCDGLVWNFLLSEDQQSYMKRPVLQVICKRYFQEKGFFTGSQCSSSKDSPSSFQTCFSESFTKADSFYLSENKCQDTVSSRQKSAVLASFFKARSSKKSLNTLAAKGVLLADGKKFFLCQEGQVYKNKQNEDFYELIDPKKIKAEDKKELNLLFDHKKKSLHHTFFNKAYLVDAKSLEIEAIKKASYFIQSHKDLFENERSHQHKLASFLKLEEKKNSLENESENLFEQYSKTEADWILEKTQFVNNLIDKNIARTIWPFFNLKMTFTREQIKLSVLLDQNNTPEFKELNATWLRQEKNQKAQQNSSILNLQIDEAKGFISFDISLNDPSFFGLKANDAINSEKPRLMKPLKDCILKLRFYKKTLENSVYFSGQASLYLAGKQVEKGYISLS